MKFTVNKESGPLFKAGEQDEKGLPVVWAKAGEVVDIQVDSTDPKERTRASRWLRGQHGKISLYHSGEKPKGCRPHGESRHGKRWGREGQAQERQGLGNHGDI